MQVGQKNNALQTLHDTITNKRQQRNWTKALEQVCRLRSSYNVHFPRFYHL